jgi:hypothetical protein
MGEVVMFFMPIPIYTSGRGPQTLGQFVSALAIALPILAALMTVVATLINWAMTGCDDFTSDRGFYYVFGHECTLVESIRWSAGFWWHLIGKLW